MAVHAVSVVAGRCEGQGMENERENSRVETECGQLSPKEKFKWAVKRVQQYNAVPGYRISDIPSPLLSGILYFPLWSSFQFSPAS